MKSFIFFSPEGVCLSPDDNVMENLQVMGTVTNALDKEAALAVLLEDNSWIEQFGYNTEEFICMELKPNSKIKKQPEKLPVNESLGVIYNNEAHESILNKSTKTDLIDFVMEVFNKGILNNYLGFR